MLDKKFTTWPSGMPEAGDVVQVFLPEGTSTDAIIMSRSHFEGKFSVQLSHIPGQAPICLVRDERSDEEECDGWSIWKTDNGLPHQEVIMFPS